MCVTGDTYISTRNGLVEIKDLPYGDNELTKKELNILSINNTFQKTSHLYRKRVNKTIKITTQLGFEIEGRPEHPIATFNENLDIEFKRLKDINEGDYVILEHSDKVFASINYQFDYKERKYESLIECCICKNKFKQLDRHIIKTHFLSVEEYKQRYSTKKIISEEIIYSKHQNIKIPSEMTKELARIFGYYIGDGSWLSNRTMTFTNNDKLVVEDFVHCLETVFGIDNLKINKIANFYRVELYNNKIFDFFEYCGLKKAPAFMKEIPFTILQSTEEIIREFLKALFECDGHNSGKVRKIGYVSTSRKLVKQIHLLLFHLDILSVLGKECIHDNKNHRPSTTLRVLGVYYEKFMMDIGFISARKNESYKTIEKHNSRYGKIPFIKKQLLKILPYNKGYMSSRENSEIHQNELKDEQLLRHIKKIDLSLYNKILSLLLISKNRLYVKVISKEENNRDKEVYDVSIPSNHIFLSNGFISHNSRICNEGWASYFHAEIINNYDEINSSEMLEFAKLHSSVVNPGSPGSLNPYYLGYKILVDIEKRWDELHKKGESTLTGREKLFEVRTEEDDISFIRNYLTEDLAEELNLFSYGQSCEHDHSTKKCDKCGELKIKSRKLDDIIESIIINKINYGVPKVSIMEVKNEELCLKQDTMGLPGLDPLYAEKTIQYIYDLWKRPIHIETTDESNHSKELWYAGKK